LTEDTVSVFPDPESLAAACADLFAREARRAVEAYGSFSVALAGGSTPARAYELLAEPRYARGVPWERTLVFWGDERCVPPDDPRSNERMARRVLLDSVPVPRDQIFPMRCSGLPADEAADYDALVHGLFPLPGPGPDLVLLGLGENGHTASLFPGSSALRDQERWVTAAFVEAAAGAGTTAAGHDLWRITFTAPFLNRASVVAFVVSGAAKAGVVREVIEGDRDPLRLPAQLIRPSCGRLYWLLDEGAASLLARR
jgi:6-phosphogluconolactonase